LQDFISLFWCCDQKVRAACAQNFTLWQITRHDHSIMACSRHVYMYAFNATPTERLQVATTFPPFCNEPHPSHVLFVKVSHGTTFNPGHSTILLRSEGPSGFIWFISICLRFKCFLILFCHFVLACLSVSFLFSGVPFIHSFFFFGSSVGCCAALLMLIFFYIYTASSPPLFQVGYTTNDW